MTVNLANFVNVVEIFEDIQVGNNSRKLSEQPDNHGIAFINQIDTDKIVI